MVAQHHLTWQKKDGTRCGYTNGVVLEEAQEGWTNVKKKNSFNDEPREMLVHARIEDLRKYLEHPTQLIQVALPQLDDEEREFIMTGNTPEDWERMFGET